MRPPWRIELLGWLRAEWYGGSTAQTVTRFATHQTAVLLARLALGPHRAHAREELVDTLWPDADYDRARARLRQALSSLRHQLEPPGVSPGSILIADRTHIRLNPDAFVTDVAEFEAATRAGRSAEAAALYRGDLLPGFYEDWVLAERERLYEMRLRLDSSRFMPSATVISPRPVGDSAVVPATEPEIPPRELGLPPTLTRFFGRAGERAQIAALLTETALVTLTGPGGAGKTRLAVEAARFFYDRLDPTYTTRFADLSDLTDAARLTETLAERLGIPTQGATPARDRLRTLLAATPTLLLLDNLEQLLPGAGAEVESLLNAAPTLKVLATSRRPLGVGREREFPVPALPVPALECTPDQMVSVPSVQLFVDRAQAARPDFQVTSGNAGAVATLCRRLEGSPLALELAAARAGRLSPAKMVAWLPRRFDLLVARGTGRGDARHHSLRATIAWSVELLPENVRQFWRALAVFPGGFTVEAAAEVVGEPLALAALHQLRENSLITGESRAGVVRYRLGESLRQFGQEQVSPAAWCALQERHLRWFADWSEGLRPRLQGFQQESLLEQVTAESENLHAALAWSLEPGGNARDGLRLVACLNPYWLARGDYYLVREWLNTLLRHPDNLEASPWRVRALHIAGSMALFQNDRAAEKVFFEDAFAAARAIDDPMALGATLVWRAWIMHHEGDLGAARTALESAVREYERAESPLGAAVARANLAEMAAAGGDYATATACFQQVVNLFRQSGNLSGLTHHSRLLGTAYANTGDPVSACRAFRESLDGYLGLGDLRGLAQLLGEIAMCLKPSEAAVRLLGASEAFHHQVGAVPLHTMDDSVLASHRATLGPEPFAQAWHAGTSLTRDEAVAETRAVLGQSNSF